MLSTTLSTSRVTNEENCPKSRREEKLCEHDVTVLLIILLSHTLVNHSKMEEERTEGRFQGQFLKDIHVTRIYLQGYHQGFHRGAPCSPSTLELRRIRLT